MPSSPSYRQKWWIYYALRNSAFDACSTFCADDNGSKLTALKCPFEWYQVWYMFTQKIVSKSHLNKGHYTNSAEFPPYYNTFRPWRHFLRLLFGCVSMGGRSCQSTRRNMFIMHQVLLVLHAVLASPCDTIAFLVFLVLLLFLLLVVRNPIRFARSACYSYPGPFLLLDSFETS